MEVSRSLVEKSKIGRVINGILKRRTIKMPMCDSIRPTSDIVKEMVFNVLLHRFYVDFSQTGVIDLFAGSGALGIESISLGSENVMFVDNNILAINCIRENLNTLKVASGVKILRQDVSAIDKNSVLTFFSSVDNIVIFMDPPYKDKQLLTSQLENLKSIFENAGKDVMFVIETDEDWNIKSLSEPTIFEEVLGAHVPQNRQAAPGRHKGLGAELPQLPERGGLCERFTPNFEILHTKQHGKTRVLFLKN